MKNYDKALTVQMLNLTNQERMKLDIPPLVWDNELTRCAYLHTLNMIRERRIFHICPKGLNVNDRANEMGITWKGIGENVSFGNRHPKKIPIGYKTYDYRLLFQFFGLMSSKGHRENILLPEFTHTGIVVIGDNSHPKYKKLIYTCQVFKA